MSNPLPPTTLIFAPKGRRPLALPIVRGQVVVVSDASGMLPNDWQLSLIENSPSGTARIIQDGDVLSQEFLHLVGFNLPLPDVPVREFLATFCADTEGILREFELSDVATLSCAYLPPAPSRQIALLHAFSKEQGIIILNDPFLPFNGRWRESFAAFIAEQASLGGAAVVCCNVGFMPKTWTNLPSVKMQDIAALLPLPAEMRVASPTPQPEAPESSPSSMAPRQITEANEAYYAPGIPVPIPASAIRVYKEVKDWIFEPLATASRFLRTWSGIVVALGLSVVLGTMGVLLVPNLPEARALLVRLSEKFTYQLKDVIQSSPPSQSPEEENGTLREESKIEDDNLGNESSHIRNEPTMGDSISASSESIILKAHEANSNTEHMLMAASSSPFSSFNGVPFNTEVPLFSLYVIETSSEEESTEHVKVLMKEITSDSAMIFNSYGAQISPTLSYTCLPFRGCFGWTRNLQNLQERDFIDVLPVKNEEGETEITLQGDTDPPATEE